MRHANASAGTAAGRVPAIYIKHSTNTAPTQHAGFCNISGRPFATLLSQRTDKHQPWPCLALPPYIVDSCPLLFFLHFPCFQFVSLVLCCFFFLFFFLIFSIFLSLLSSLFSLTYLLFFFFFFLPPAHTHAWADRNTAGYARRTLRRFLRRARWSKPNARNRAFVYIFYILKTYSLLSPSLQQCVLAHLRAPFCATEDYHVHDMPACLPACLPMTDWRTRWRTTQLGEKKTEKP